MVWIRSLIHKTVLFFKMIKLEHSIFALPFAYLGLFLGERGWPRFSLFLWVTAAMVSFRTMAMALNRLIDWRIDGLNPRTKNRALPQGQMKFFFVWSMVFFAFVIFEVSAYQLGPLCFKLSPIPVFLAWFYPWTKRFTWLSHIFLGIILGIAPYGAWLASRGEFSWIPGLLTLGVTAWVAGFDMIYALQDLEFDRLHGFFSFPARFGLEPCLILTQVLHGLAIVSWWIAGWFGGAGMIYFLGIGLAGLCLLRETWLIRSFGTAKIPEAFFTMNAVVSMLLFLALVFDFSFRRFFS
jgi:4-hydroxybenzoate polyprenyltransferase